MCKMYRLLYLLQFAYFLNELASLGLAQSTRQPPQVRLVGGNTHNEGRVEVYYQGVWGTVCDDIWDLDDAKVVCRQIGYPTASHAWQNAHFGRGSGPILLDNVHCYGDEASLADCSHNAWYSNDCSHGEDAGVTCSLTSTSQPTSSLTKPVPSVTVRLVGGNTPNEGTVEVYYQGVWGTVCDDIWDLRDARVVCRQLGYPTASNAWPNAHFGQGSGPILLDDVHCYGYYYETSLADCSHSVWYSNDCSHSEDAGVTCSLTSITPQPTSLLTKPVPSVTVRLVGGNTPNEGTVEVYYQGVWGTVCDDSWDLNDAKVVCRQLGYPDAIEAWQAAHFGEGSGPILMDDVHCYGYEASLAYCTNNGYTNNCFHGEDAGVTCSLPTGTVPVTGSLDTIRLSAPGFSQGNVQMYTSDQGWIDVCADSTWNLESAQVVCRQLGFSEGSASIQSTTTARASTNTYSVYSLSCGGYEETLSECSWATPYLSDTCYSASVNCDTPSGLSTGAIAAIVVVPVLGLIAIVTVIAICLVYNIRNKRRSQTAARSVPPRSAGQSGTNSFNNPAYTETPIPQLVPGTQQPLGPPPGYVSTSYPTQTQSVAYHVPSTVGNAQNPPPGFAPMPFVNQTIYSNLAPQAAISQTPNPSSVSEAVSSDVKPPQQGNQDPDQKFPMPSNPPEFPSDSMKIYGGNTNEAEV